MSCLLCVVCVVTSRSLRRADRSSRRVLSCMVCRTAFDCEASATRRLWPTRGCRTIRKTKHTASNFCARLTEFSSMQAVLHRYVSLTDNNDEN
jgi:hypothetical protein